MPATLRPLAGAMAPESAINNAPQCYGRAMQSTLDDKISLKGWARNSMSATLAATKTKATARAA
jgi:hypothetical protein